MVSIVGRRTQAAPNLLHVRSKRATRQRPISPCISLYLPYARWRRDSPRAAVFDLMVLAHFPSSKHFFDAWSDPELVRDAYPLRQAMLQSGFQHVWLRCEQAESSEFQRLAWIRRPDAHRPSASDELDGDDYFKLALAAFILGMVGSTQASARRATTTMSQTTSRTAPRWSTTPSADATRLSVGNVETTKLELELEL